MIRKLDTFLNRCTSGSLQWPHQSGGKPYCLAAVRPFRFAYTV